MLLGQGNGAFQSAVTYGSGGYGASAIAVADVNGDIRQKWALQRSSALGSRNAPPGIPLLRRSCARLSVHHESRSAIHRFARL